LSDGFYQGWAQPTATRIFYAEGIHSVGVDRIIAEAKVTRATF
jgi:AcrR family transcriptional regulator